ncbi:MAG: TetR/AcrR family transcriptional regulator [Synergistaceae bacterium]|nr:TetR/AcrR family transcriptional regulator [Synergistaceae bacterium]
MAEKVKDTKRILLNAARKGFAEKGYYGTSMEFIVRKTGLSKGTIYWYFPGKWELYKAVLSEEIERILTMIIPPDMEALEGSGMDFLISRGDRLIESLTGDSLSRLLFVHLSLEAMRGEGEMVDFVASLRDTMAKDLLPLFQSIFPEGVLVRQGFSHGDMVNMFITILHGIILNLELSISREEASKIWHFLIQSILERIGHEKLQE